ncbi:MAG: hypothetical protein FJ005_03115 [Chloroflexi bacterium]|nr:hypothetical protein [Chloroflexota bacterium]
MPDSQGKLSDDEKKKVVSWLKNKWKEPAVCPYSKDSEWIIGGHLVAPTNYSKVGAVIGGDAYPLVMVICKNCGYTVFLNAVMVGILPTKEQIDAHK